MSPAQESRQLLGDVMQTQVSNMAVQIARAELDQAVVTARQYPRSIDRAMRNIITLATLSEKTATDCVYALPRAGKAIRGPSVRLAEIIAQQWGNCHVGSRIVGVDLADKVIIAEGVFHDLETGMKRISQVRRRITDRNGKLFNEDMVNVTGNAAAAIAMREAVLKGVPRGIWEEAYDRCEQVIRGDVKTLNERRESAIKAFAAFGVTPEQIFDYLEIEGEKDITLDHLATLTATRSAIKSGESQVEDFFDMTKKGPPTRRQAQPAEKREQPKEEAKKPEQSAAPKEEAKPAAGAAQPAEAETPKESTAPKEDAKSDAPVRSRHDAAYDKILNSAIDANNVDAALTHYAAEIDAMQKEAPETYRRLMEELDAFANGGDEEQGRMDV
ncbi:MAG: hypothetical protein F9K41_00005 [Sphingopyxis terrae]|nr:MAG: hypothetical protein F9K41_00005 [Sphingopyxis terrae]